MDETNESSGPSSNGPVGNQPNVPQVPVYPFGQPVGRSTESQQASSSEAYRNAHAHADTDTSRTAIHHTLGPDPTQAAPGNHEHPAVPAELTGVIKEFAGFVCPADYYFCDGTTKSRATDAALFSTLSIPLQGNTTNGSAVITGCTTTQYIETGMPLSAPGIPLAATVVSTTANTITMSHVCSLTQVGVAIVVCPWGVGNGVSTFNLPDKRVRVSVGAGTGKRLGGVEGAAEVSRNAMRLGYHSHGAGSTGVASAGSTSNDSAGTPSGSVSTAPGHTHGSGTLSAGSNNDRAAGTGSRANTIISGDTGSAGGHGHTFTGSALSGHGHTFSTATHSHPISVSSDYSGEAPYAAVNYIIKR